MAESAFLKYGQRLRAPSEHVLFRPSQPTEEKSVYYPIAGIVGLEVPHAHGAAPFHY